jgi:hypothetical protein
MGNSTGGRAGDWPYRFEVAPLDRLFVDKAYQRPLTTFAQVVAEDWNPALVGTLIASERSGGRLAVVDGQTRMHGAEANDVEALPCVVYTGLTRAQEAELFADLQTKRRGMATYLRFRAALVAKRPEAVAIAALVQAAGFELDTEETPRTVKAIAALEYVYRRDPALLDRVMRLIARAWPDETEYRTSGEVIRGMAVFLTREARVDENRLVDRLSGVTPKMLRHRANALKEGSGSGGGSPGYMADAILGVYMRGGKRAA